MKFILRLAFSCCIFSCSSVGKENAIIIKGTVKNIPAKKVFLGDAYDFRKNWDSATIVNDTFSFHFAPVVEFIPRLASIYFWDSGGEPNVLTYRNYKLSPTGPAKYAMTAFMLEKGEIIITGDNLAKNKLDIKAQRETDLFNEMQMMDFGNLDKNNINNRPDAISKIESMIKKNPFSFYLLQCIVANRYRYSKDELSHIFLLFTDDVQKSSPGQRLASYIAIKQDTSLPYPDIELETLSSIRQSVINYNKKLNLLVFWASWCGPCRQEIPELRILDSMFSNTGLNISSIAVDDKKSEWIKALKFEKMPWNQFFTDSIQSENVKARFSIGAIPVRHFGG